MVREEQIDGRDRPLLKLDKIIIGTVLGRIYEVYVMIASKVRITPNCCYNSTALLARQTSQ